MPKAARIALPLLLIAAVYSIWPLATIAPPETTDTMLLVWIIASLAAGVANIVAACLDHGEGSPRRLAFWDMLLKLCMVPFYLLLFGGGLILSTAMAVIPGLIFAMPFLVAILVAIDYVLLLITSSYGFSAAVRAYRQGLITCTAAVVLSVLHLMFVTDVIAAIVLYTKIRKADNPKIPSSSI